MHRQLQILALLLLAQQSTFAEIEITSETNVNIFTLKGLPEGSEPLVEVESKDWNEPDVKRYGDFYVWSGGPGLYRIRVAVLFDGRWTVTRKVVEIKDGTHPPNPNPDPIDPKPDDPDPDDPKPDKLTIEYAARRYAIALKDREKSDAIAKAWNQAADDMMMGKTTFVAANKKMRSSMVSILSDAHFKTIDKKFGELFKNEFEKLGGKMPPEKASKLFREGAKGWQL